ncbi:Uncharacterised protein [Mycobacteroides abscessus subsp. abscessus]|nr:Uncharacterised protein [Mycobacteroides abscessus subsp. abscessus]
MTAAIGSWSDTRPTCDDVHVPGCFNPWLRMTWCLCGDVQWHGAMPTLHARQVHDGYGQGAQLVGYDVYWMEATA